MPDVQAKVKLTAKQQEVVNLMAAGYSLSYHRSMGRFCDASASLHSKGGQRWGKVASNVPDQLRAKGVVVAGHKDWQHEEYTLTDIGKSLAKPIVKPSNLETWWSVTEFSNAPTPVKFVSSTEAYLVDEQGRRTCKSTGYETWYPTREAAVQALRGRLRLDISNAESALKAAKKALVKFETQEGSDA
jgi:hypothetical protein